MILFLGVLMGLNGCTQNTLPTQNHFQPQIRTLQSQTQTSIFYSTAILAIPENVPVADAWAGLRDLRDKTRQETGNLVFKVHQDVNHPRQIVIWEAFKDQAAFQAHLQSPHLQAFLKQNLVSFIQAYSAQASSSSLPAEESSGYFSSALLTLQTGKDLQQAKTAFAKLETLSRQESGNRMFVVLPTQHAGQPAFMLWEHFQDQAAFQSHLNSAHLKDFLALNLVTFEKGFTLHPL